MRILSPVVPPATGFLFVDAGDVLHRGTIGAKFSIVDPRFDAGHEILEKDHQELGVVLDNYTKTAKRTIHLVQLDEKQACDEAGQLHGVTETIEAFLTRHLSDEEELAVPIILHQRLHG